MNYKQFIQDVLLIEIPWISIDNDKTVDIHLELHSTDTFDDIVRYIQDIISGKVMASKYKDYSLSAIEIPKFIEKLKNNMIFTDFILYKFGKENLAKLINVLNKTE